MSLVLFDSRTLDNQSTDIPLQDLSQKMKFNRSLQLNAVPEWATKYLDYSALKRTIYQLEKSSVARLQGSDNEEAALMADANQDPVQVFEKKLNSELNKIDTFYTGIEAQIYKQLNQVIDDYEDYLQRLSLGSGKPEDDEDLAPSDPYLFRENFRNSEYRQQRSDSEEDEDDDFAVRKTRSQSPPRPFRESSQGPSTRRSRSRSRARSVAEGASLPVKRYTLLDDIHITLKKRSINVYVSLCELRSYSQMNKTGFSKALKKFDKTLNCHLRERYMENTISKSYVYSQNTEAILDDKINEATILYSKLSTDGDFQLARTELRLHLREHVVWERNTVWRDLIGLERKAHAAAVGSNSGDVKLQGETVEKRPPYVKVLGVNIPSILLSSGSITFIVIVLIFLAILSIDILDSPEQNKCLAVVIAASLLWATEAMPLFTTSLLVPFLVICLRIPCNDEGEPMTAPEASKYIFSQMWSSVIMLLLGGFTLAAALSKFHIAKMLATQILTRSGTNPKFVLFSLMSVAAFLSMWISNVAAPVLCYSIAQPLLRTIPKGSPFGKAVVLGIALASNVGGMASPIASPQNIIALENMDPAPSWVQWFAVSIPVCVLAIIAIWALLIATFNPGKGMRVTAPIRAVDDRFTFQQIFICVVTVLTIVSWCLSHQLEPYVGDMGVLALIPIVVFFGTGLLTGEDFNNFLWTIIALAMGGIALGKAVATSGLLDTIAHGIEQHVVRGLGLYGVMAVFGIMILVVATFVSHTVAALIILPLVQSIGVRMEDPHPRLLVMAAAFLCSSAMGLPTSGFPNVTAICMTDEVGRPYLTVGNFISRGVPASVLSYAVVVTVGYLLMLAIGF